MSDITHLPPPDWNIALAFFGSCFLVFAIGRFLGHRFLNLNSDERTIFGMAAVFSNNVQLGIPVAVALLGQEAMPSIAIIFSLNGFLMWTLVTIAIELGRAKSPSIVTTVTKGTLQTIRNPIVIGIILGFLWSISNLSMPAPMSKTIGDAGRDRKFASRHHCARGSYDASDHELSRTSLKPSTKIRRSAETRVADAPATRLKSAPLLNSLLSQTNAEFRIPTGRRFSGNRTVVQGRRSREGWLLNRQFPHHWESAKNQRGAGFFPSPAVPKPSMLILMINLGVSCHGSVHARHFASA